MDDPTASPGDHVWVRTLSGGVMGPLVVESVEVTLNMSGRVDRYKFRVDPARGYAGAYPVDSDRVFRTAEGAKK